MDPRHPELAVSRIKELIEQYDRIEKDMAKANTSAQLGQLEREGGLVVQEICLVAPRIHEAMMQVSRQRRHALTHGEIVGPTHQIIAINEATTEEAEVVEKPVEELVKDKADVIGEENIGGESGPAKKAPEIASEGVLEVIEAAKKNAKAGKKTAAKKTTREKKNTKKAEE